MTILDQGVCQRTLTVDLRWQKDENGNLWFVAKDVCDMLGLTNVTTSLQSLDEDEKDLMPKKSLGIANEKGQQDVNLISESGMYALIMRSNKEEARRFRKWVTSEVLPSIRRTGKYETIRDVVDRMEREEEEIRRTVVAVMIHGDQKQMSIDLGIGEERLRYWLRGKQQKSGRRSLNREEVMAVLAWVREKNYKLATEHTRAQIEMKF